MKKIHFLIAALAIMAASCQKTSTQKSVTLDASSKSVAVGETVTVTAHSVGVNSYKWSVTPETNVAGIYSITTENANYYTFSEPGIYTVNISTRNLPLDSMHHCDHGDSLHHIQDSIWNHHIGDVWHDHDNDNGGNGGGCGHGGGHDGHPGCHLGQDSASIIITVRSN